MVSEKKAGKKGVKKAVKQPKKELKPKKKAETVKKEAVPKKDAVKTIPYGSKKDPWNILKFPYLTEKSTRMIEAQNKLVFVVKDRSTKQEIKDAVENLFAVKVKGVNTTATTRGEKKAYVRLAPEFKAVDIATKLGMM